MEQTWKENPFLAIPPPVGDHFITYFAGNCMKCLHLQIKLTGKFFCYILYEISSFEQNSFCQHIPQQPGWNTNSHWEINPLIFLLLEIASPFQTYRENSFLSTPPTIKRCAGVSSFNTFCGKCMKYTVIQRKFTSVKTFPPHPLGREVGKS